MGGGAMADDEPWTELVTVSEDPAAKRPAPPTPPCRQRTSGAAKAKRAERAPVVPEARLRRDA